MEARANHTNLQEVKEESLDFSDPTWNLNMKLLGWVRPWRLQELDICWSQLQLLVAGIEATHDL